MTVMAVQIYRLPVLGDNYIFFLHDRTQNTAAVVDPAEPKSVLQQLQRLGATLTTIFNTHHHSDHVGGNRSLLQHFPQAQVYGGAQDRDRIPGQQHFLQAGDRVTFGGHKAEILFIPGHTRAHIAYFFPGVSTTATSTTATSTTATSTTATSTTATLMTTDGNALDPEDFPSAEDPLPLGVVGDLFCGDTLFAGGCGRLFEGTPAQMLNSLNQIRQLPDSTRIWCAHEYTLNNLRFALTVDRHNSALQQRWQQVQNARQHNIATVPSVLGLEKRTNPFLRWDQPALQTAVNSQDPVQTFSRLRGKKDLF